MGARPLRRAIQRHIEDPLADFVLMSELEPGSTILVDRKEGEEEVDITVIAGPAKREKVTVPAEPEPSGDDAADDPDADLRRSQSGSQSSVAAGRRGAAAGHARRSARACGRGSSDSPSSKRPGLVHSERIAENGGPGASGGPGSASRIDYYLGRASRLAEWHSRTGVPDRRRDDRGRRPLGRRLRRRLEPLRRRSPQPRRRRGHPARDRFALGARSLTVLRAHRQGDVRTLVYWFDARGVLNALETFAGGC